MRIRCRWPGRSARLLLTAILLLTVLRAFVAANAGLSDDEAYYRLWALAPAMSYLDHPPMVGWMIAVGRCIAGDSPFGIRLGAISASLLGPLVLWRTAHILFGPAVARRAVWFVLAMPLLAVGGIIITPDTPSVLLWGLVGWALAELHVSRQANWWLAVGIFAGLGLLSKYTNLFAAAGVLLWLMLLPANRQWFRSWQLWAGGLIAVLLALPVVVWNAEHGWASFAKQFGRVSTGAGFHATYFLELLGGYLVLASPLIAVLGLLGLWKIVRSFVTERDQACTLLAVSILPLLAYLMLHAAHDRVQPNWVAPVYPALALCAAAFSEERKNASSFKSILTKCALGLGLFLSALIYGHTLHPFALPPGRPDPTAQMRGWAELASTVDRLRRLNEACWIATSSYATTGQLAYALREQATVVQLTERLRYVHLPRIDDNVLKCPAIYVELERRARLELVGKYFQTLTSLGRLTRRFGGTPIANYTVYLLSAPTRLPPFDQ